MDSLLNLHGVVVKTNNRDEYFCHICDKSFDEEEKTVDHIGGEQHKKTLVLFDDTFVIESGKINCKECNFHGGWLEVKKHVNIHLSAPWYKPTDFYKKCFDNFLNDHENTLYCYICKCLLPTNVWQAINHITSDLHVELKNSIACHEEDDIVQLTPVSDKSYCSFIQNGIVKTSGQFLYYCQICDCNVWGYINLTSHIAGQHHLVMKKLYEFEDITLLCNNLVCIEKSIYYCRTCNYRIIGAKNISRHLDHPEHHRAQTYIRQ